MTPTAFLSIGLPEMMMIGLVALLVFGGRLPEVMGNLGRAYGKFRRGLNEMARPIKDEMRRLDREANPYRPPEPGPSETTPYETGTEPDAGVPAPAGDEALEGRAAEAVPPATTEPPEPAPRKERKPSIGAADEPPPV